MIFSRHSFFFPALGRGVHVDTAAGLLCVTGSGGLRSVFAVPGLWGKVVGFVFRSASVSFVLGLCFRWNVAGGLSWPGLALDRVGCAWSGLEMFGTATDNHITDTI